ncbi:MAG TPA: glycosyltransferase family 4 protein [Candidatus Dormibacteraeota bacterium]|nr:glycosyltransferase family 4 protein [Candidatus Dormibacteraeota bacterium]
MIPRSPGVSRAREAARRWLPLSLRARVMRSGRRLVLAPAAAARGIAHGGFDVPTQGATVSGEVVQIIGWAMCEGQMASSVDIRLDGVPAGRARLGLGRSDLAALGPEATASGFEFQAALPGADGTRHVISAVAHFGGGARLVIDGPTVGVARRAERNLESLSLPGVPAASGLRPGRGGGRTHVLAVTHQLDLGGGQLYLQDLLRGLARTGRFDLTVASNSDGPLRSELEELGIGVHLLGRWPQASAVTLESRLDELCTWVREQQVDAVLVNTVIGFPAVRVAARLGIPTLWAIHESYPIPILWHALLGDGADARVIAAARDALTQADRLLFEAESTRQLYVSAAGEDRCLLVPYGVELASLDAATASLDRTLARRRLGVPQRARLLLCMGTFEMRKSQTVLIRAFSDVADRHPDASLVLVGDNGSDYAGHVHRLAEATGLGGRIRIVPVGPDILPWYVAADVLVSASDVESTPRSAIEAMFFETPVLAADVYGLSELVDDGATGWLVAARDVDALAGGLDRALAASDADLRRMGRHARERVRRDHDSSRHVAAIARLLDDLVASRASISEDPPTDMTTARVRSRPRQERRQPGDG